MPHAKNFEKYLTLLLRHRPEVAGLRLDGAGWVKIEDLMEGLGVSFDELDAVVRYSSKRRFEYDVTGTFLRACQGHSIDVDLGLKEVEPSEVLYHGTAKQNLTSIYEAGIQKMSRRFVQLTEHTQTALEVGARHGSPVVLFVYAERMWRTGYKFYRSTNGVWLTDHVPVSYIRR